MSAGQQRRREEKTALVVGRPRGEDLLALRLVVAPDGSATVLRSAELPWVPGAPLGEPLERALGWLPSEAVVIAVPTPLFVGGSLTLRWARSGDAALSEGRRLSRRQERALAAAWETRERMRERAARFLECPLADVQLLTEDLGPWYETLAAETVESTALFAASWQEDEALTAPPSDVPDAHLVVLPLLVSELSATDDPAGLLFIEEERCSFVLRSGARLGDARSIPLGGDELVYRVQRALSCSPREARAVLDRCEASALPPDLTRVLGNILRPLVPLFRAGVTLLTEDAVRTGALFSIRVAGVWATVLQRFVLGSRAILGGQRGYVVPKLLIPSEVRLSVSPGDVLGQTDRALLLLLAAAVVRRARVSVPVPAGNAGHSPAGWPAGA